MFIPQTDFSALNTKIFYEVNIIIWGGGVNIFHQIKWMFRRMQERL
jgi:hypothetical protein